MSVRFPSRCCGFAAATAEERADYLLIGGGIGIHWPRIDEDLSVAGLLRGD